MARLLRSAPAASACWPEPASLWVSSKFPGPVGPPSTAIARVIAAGGGGGVVCARASRRKPLSFMGIARVCATEGMFCHSS